MTSTRRERERADRHRLIIAMARELAEAEGWDAVTTRRLAERVEYSQPVLYSHFANKDAIIQAVALDGFAEFAQELARARAAAPTRALRAVITAYLDFAADHPALYEAMFALPLQVPFGDPERTPAPLKAAFNEIVAVLSPEAPDESTDILAELLWSTLHGVAELSRGGRLPTETHTARVHALERLMHAWTGSIS